MSVAPRTLALLLVAARVAAAAPLASTPAASTPAASTPAASTPAASTPAASTPAPGPAAEKREPYRAMVMFGDGVGLVFTLGFGTLMYRSRNCECEDFSGEGVILGLGMYLVFGAVAHADAGHSDRAVASVALRAALPIAAGEGAHLAGASTGWSVAAAGAGMLAAMGLDWFVLAEATRPVKPKTAVYVTPVAGGGAVAGIGGVLP